MSLIYIYIHISECIIYYYSSFLDVCASLYRVSKVPVKLTCHPKVYFYNSHLQPLQDAVVEFFLAQTAKNDDGSENNLYLLNYRSPTIIYLIVRYGVVICFK